MIVVISQPMFFPWVGMFEQIRLANVYVHYSDVQFSKGSFVNRVQIKTADGIRWLTVPLEGLTLGQKINEVRISSRGNWRHRHLEMLRQAYDKSFYRDDMLSLVESVYRDENVTIGQLSEATLMAVCRYFGFDKNRRFVEIEDLGIGGSSSRRVLEVVQALGGNVYVTGLGARDYLNHELFENAGINVQYMNYRKTVYPQLHGEFTPFVSVLDLIANAGPDGERVIRSESVYWRDFLNNE